VFERFRDPDEFNELLQRDYAQRYLKLTTCNDTGWAFSRHIPAEDARAW
jgi:hypothetical protein